MLVAIALNALSSIAIIPQPVEMTAKTGTFTLSAKTPLVVDKAAKGTSKLASEQLGLKAGRGAGVVLHINPALKDLGGEGYQLDVTSKGIQIQATTEAGLFYGVQTLRQLIPASEWKHNAGWHAEIPCVSIRDYPRFAWRGSHLDCGRHYLPLAFVKKYIDTLALHKLNRFHWHLTDDQGWRIEIKKYPKLTEIGSKRKRSMLKYSPAVWDEKPHGGFYTQAEAKEIVKYAAERHIEVIPEIEMPGHAQAAIAAYPELGNSGKPVEVREMWGVSPVVYNPSDKVIQFNKDVLTEVMNIFPSKFIHVGGDECPKDEWKASPAVQARMKELGIKTEHDLQSWFIRQMDTFLASKGRRLIGWSEILEGGLAPGAALMVWLGDDGAMEAVSSGHDVVMAQNAYTYFDYYQVKDHSKEPHAIGGNLPLSRVYKYEPILPKMTDEQAKHVLGVQWQLWTEYIATPEYAEYMAFPRGCAIAEIAWSPKSSRDWESFQERLKVHETRLDALGVNYRHGHE